MTRNEIIETMARAITEAKGENPDCVVSRFDVEANDWQDEGPLWRTNIDLAQAALTALEAAGVRLCEGEPAGFDHAHGHIDDGQDFRPISREKLGMCNVPLYRPLDTGRE